MAKVFVEYFVLIFKIGPWDFIRTAFTDICVEYVSKILPRFLLIMLQDYITILNIKQIKTIRLSVFKGFNSPFISIIIEARGLHCSSWTAGSLFHDFSRSKTLPRTHWEGLFPLLESCLAICGPPIQGLGLTTCLGGCDISFVLPSCKYLAVSAWTYIKYM